MALHALELCSGYAGFSLAFRLAGLDVRTVCHVERDSHAAATLVARMEDETLDRAPVWGDLCTFDGSRWAGAVDLVTAGFPCQPWSAAGAKRGIDDDRWLWPHIAPIIADVGPRLVLLENVPQLNPGTGVGGLPFVLQDLADLGFDAQWGLLSAAAVGAPHRRQRFWLLAYRDLDGLAVLEGEGLFDGRRPPGQHDAHGPRGADVAARDVDGLEILGSELRERGRLQTDDADRSSGEDVGHADSPAGRQESGHGQGGQGGLRPIASDGAQDAVEDVAAMAHAARLGEREPDDGSGAFPRSDTRLDPGGRSWPPGPDDVDGWLDWIARGGPEPQVRRDSDERSGRLVRPRGLSDRLHLLGNGLVPVCAAIALNLLARRFNDPVLEATLNPISSWDE